MRDLPASGIAPVAEAEAAGDIADEYADIRRVLELPFVPNFFKATAQAPQVLAGSWALERNLFLETSLPMPLAAMILLAISAARNSEYCTSVHRLTCQSLGIDEPTLLALQGDPSALPPGQERAAVRFALKAALEPRSLGRADYGAVRDEGFGDRELVELAGLAALGNYLDTLADTLQVPLDDIVRQALAG